MSDNLNEHSEQIIGLTDLMVQTLQATIDADRSTADEYYRILEENSFVQNDSKDGPEELQMVDVRIRNADGRTQIISMPKLILMPVPMLHISEASFELEGTMCLNTTEETKTETTNTSSAPSKSESTNKSSSGGRVSIPQGKFSQSRYADQTIGVQLPSTVKRGEESGNSTENSQTTTNLKISMKLTQSDMPSGLVNLLQVITNNIQVKNE